MVKKLSEDQMLKFVSLYRENPCLWDISSEDYKNKPMRQSALQNLCIGMEIEGETFNFHTNTQIEGFTVEDVKNKIKSICSTYNLEQDKIKKSSTSGASGNVYQPKLKWFAEFNSFIKNDTGEDEFDNFGKHIAKQLRTLSTKQAILGQDEIQSVITKCRLRDLKYRNMTMSSPAYSAHTQVSDDYAARPSTSTSAYMPLNSPASTVDTQSTDDSFYVTSNDRDYINIIMNAFNNA
ncbi:hypothetical protein K1T71_011815 [Dendrolimus kikuchii]|uniref:Uncharacterized protein n=1 Tax=Dendrolimus kikuchii TaxID=765133 RepID=A0ACC1CMC3_9NEOP|nr:hypothetical protein K1T71_011815 [Dendrolimus kikuchii]